MTAADPELPDVPVAEIPGLTSACRSLSLVAAGLEYPAAWSPCPQALFPLPAHAGPALAVVAERSLRPALAVIGNAGQPVFPADAARNAGCPAAWNLPPVGHVFPAEREAFAVPVPDIVAALWGHAVGSGNSAAEARAAAPPVGDTDPLNTAAGREAAGQAPARQRGPIYPNRFYAVPSHGPSDHPNAEAHQIAIRGSMLEDGGNSAQESAG